MRKKKSPQKKKGSFIQREKLQRLIIERMREILTESGIKIYLDGSYVDDIRWVVSVLICSHHLDGDGKRKARSLNSRRSWKRKTFHWK